MSILILIFSLFQLYPEATFSIIKIIVGFIKKIRIEIIFFLLYCWCRWNR